MIRQQVGAFEHVVEFTPAYDRRPEGKGQHVAEIRFAVVGPEGAVSVTIFTGWSYDACSRPDHERYALFKGTLWRPTPQGAAVVWHPKVTADADGATPCEFVGHCGHCGKDGDIGFSAGDPLFVTLTTVGEEAFWEQLIKLYRQQWPEVAS